MGGGSGSWNSAAVRVRSDLGQISESDRAMVVVNTPLITDEIVQEIKEREVTTDHDVAAFVDVMQSHIDHPAARWFHYGLTSADVTDTALCFRLTEATDLVIEVAEKLLATLCERAREFALRPHGRPV